MKGKKHSLKVHLRAFHIWQLLGYNPWKSEWAIADDVPDYLISDKIHIFADKKIYKTTLI